MMGLALVYMRRVDVRMGVVSGTGVAHDREVSRSPAGAHRLVVCSRQRLVALCCCRLRLRVQARLVRLH